MTLIEVCVRENNIFQQIILLPPWIYRKIALPYLPHIQDGLCGQLWEDMKHNIFRPECKTVITVSYILLSACRPGVKYSKMVGPHDGRTSDPWVHQLEYRHLKNPLNQDHLHQIMCEQEINLYHVKSLGFEDVC